MIQLGLRPANALDCDQLLFLKLASKPLPAWPTISGSGSTINTGMFFPLLMFSCMH